jgi:hypothetical protein
MSTISFQARERTKMRVRLLRLVAALLAIPWLYRSVVPSGAQAAQALDGGRKR